LELRTNRAVSGYWCVLRSKCGDGTGDVTACAQLDGLDSTVRQLEFAGTDTLVDTLAALARASAHHRAAAHSADADHAEVLAAVDRHRKQLRRMVDELVALSANGRISAMDLQAAMPRLTGHSMDDDDLSHAVCSLEGAGEWQPRTPEAGSDSVLPGLRASTGSF